MTLQQIEERVTEFLVEDLEIEEEKITGEARLKEDLGIDSLEVLLLRVTTAISLSFLSKKLSTTR